MNTVIGMPTCVPFGKTTTLGGQETANYKFKKYIVCRSCQNTTLKKLQEYNEKMKKIIDVVEKTN